MNPSLLVRSALRRNVTAHSLRSFASHAPPPKPPHNVPKDTSAKRSSQPTPDAQPEPSPAKATISSLPSLDFSPEEDPQSERTGAKSSKDSLSSIERKRRFLGRVSLAGLLLGAGVATWYSGRDWEDDELRELRMKRETAADTRWGRTAQRFRGVFGTFTEPLWPELLPPPLPPAHQKPYTLLLSMDDLLITSTWDRQHGWRTAKRPGVDYFLAYLAQFYEIVIFTTQYHYTAIPVLEKLDPYQFFITYKLFRDATRSVNGQPVKDLSYLNRDLSKVIILDTHPEHVSAQPENAIVLPKWDGKPGDKGLVAMIPFLESIAIYKPADVRPVLQAYAGKDIPIEYAKKEAEQKRLHVEQWEKSRKRGSTGFTFSTLFGGDSSSVVGTSNVPLTYLEQKRVEAQKHYQQEQAYLAANKENFDKLLKEEQEAMEKQMPNTFFGAVGAMFGPPPQFQPPQSQPAASTSSAPPAQK